MKIALNKAHFPVTVLGFGRRIGIWFQGCSAGCPGCISRDTWLFEEGKSIDVEVLLDWCREKEQHGFDGITISGGEPFEQPDGLTELLRGLHAWRTESRLQFDILCYSGQRHAQIQRDYPAILKLLDALIPEPFLRDRPQERLWRGSANQPLLLLSELAQRRYAPFVAAGCEDANHVQIQIDDDGLWYVGIPGRGDMELLERAVRSRGLRMGGISWLG
jgi:anaerobic ribonucleoside-triphosphate reductase activating protein